MTNIVTSVNTSVPCKGNGMTLGLYDGTNNTGLYANVSSSPYLVQNNSGAYGDAAGSVHANGALGNARSIGITLDSSKSGIVGTVTRTSITCKYCIKY